MADTIKHSNKNKNLSGSGNTGAGNAFTAIALTLVCLFSSVTADIASTHSNLLFQHSHFDNKHWERSGDTLDYNLSSGYTGLTPVKASIAGNDTNNLIMFSTTSNKLYLVHALLEPPPTYTSYPKMTVDNPVESSVGSTGSSFGVFAYTNANMDIVFLATAAASNKIAVHHIVGATYTIFRTDTLTIALPSPSCTITGLYGGPALAKGNQSCVWITGSHGLIRFFSWNGTAWGSESVHDINTTETVTAFSLAAAGTQSGKIYEDQSGSFVYHSQPGTTPINHISATGAACNEGVVLKKKGNQWSKFTVGSANYLYFNFIPRTDGAGVELLDDSWQFHKYTLEDTPTSYSILPAEVANFINSGEYKFENPDSEVISIILADPDDNYTLPAIKLNNATVLTDTVMNMHPDTACVLGFNELADTLITLVLYMDSVVLYMQTRFGVFHPISYKNYWSYKIFRHTEPWKSGDLVTIKQGNQTLSIQNGDGTTTNKGCEKQAIKPISIYRTSTGLAFQDLPYNMRAISIYNPAGRCIGSTSITQPSNVCVLPIRFSSGILLVEYLYNDGSVKRNMLTVLR